jgi:hypothetical protein
MVIPGASLSTTTPTTRFDGVVAMSGSQTSPHHP